MKKKATWSQKYNEILSSQSFEELEPYRNMKGLEPMTADDKEILARLFVAQGAHQLAAGDEKAQESFALAEQVAPKSAQVFLEIGNAFSKCRRSLPSLLAACHSYERASQLKPMEAKTWHAWAKALMSLGELQSDPEAFTRAQQYFQKAESLLQEGEAEERGSIFHNWGKLWTFQGAESGEAVDFHNALECYRRAEALGCNAVEFWNDYAGVMRRLSHLMSRSDLIQQALDYYRKAYQLDKAHPGTLYNLAELLSSLYATTSQDHYYTEALKCFRAGAEVCANRNEFWLTWACLLCFNGKVKHDIHAIEASLEKYRKADEGDPNNPLILVRWAEALRLVGAQTEDVEKLKDAEKKVIQSIEMEPGNIEGWYLWGICLCELGRYFSEESYYLQAMDKLRHALNINQQDPLVWYGLAQAYVALGDIIGDLAFFEKALGAFSRTEEFGGLPFSQYWNSWGVSLMKLAENSDNQPFVEEAIEKFEKAIAHADKIEPEWLYNYGCAHDFLGDLADEPDHYEKAIQILAKTIEVDPEFLPAYYNLALALSHLGESTQDMECFCKASEYFQILITKDSEDDLAWNDWGITLLHLAQMAFEPSLPNQAEELLNQAEEKFLQALRLGCSQANYNLACLYSLKKELPLAMQYIEKADDANVLPAIEDVMHDDWLENLRQTRAFRGFLTNLANRKPRS